MRLAFKYRLYPTKAQGVFLEEQLREACDLYNCALQERIGAWKTCRKSISYYDQARQLKPMRDEELLRLANHHCAQNVLRRLDRAFKDFFHRIKRGQTPGFPRYRSSRRYDSITFPIYGNGCKLLKIDKLYVQGTGEIKIKLHRPVEGKIKTTTIKREAGRWFVCFTVERDPKPLEPNSNVAGIDVGLTAFATLSDGTEIKNPRCYRKAQAKLRRAQRRVARRKKGGHRRRKAVLLLQRAHAHVRNQRADFHHKVSRRIVNGYGTIAVEDLNVKGLAASRLAKSVNDAGWSEFLSKIAYKAEDADRCFVKVDPRGTSQVCVCGANVPKRLKDRWHHCPSCGLSLGRDHASAMVILQRAWIRLSGANVEAVSSCVTREAVA